MICSFVFLVLLVAVSTWANVVPDDRPREVLEVSFYGLDNEIAADNAMPTPTSATTGNGDDVPLPPRGGMGRGYHGRGYHGRRGHHGAGYHHGRRHGCMGMGCMQNGGGPWWANDTTTTDERIAFICDRLRQDPGHHATHMLDVHHVDDGTRDTMLSIWNRRRTEMLDCCDRDTDKPECVREMLEARFDRVCTGEEPICPWALLGRQRQSTAGPTTGMSGIRERCCALEGDQRTQCFANVMDNYRRSNRYYHHGPGPRRGYGGRGRYNGN